MRRAPYTQSTMPHRRSRSRPARVWYSLVMSVAEVIVSNRGADRLLSGHPWVYRTDVLDAAAAGAGAVVKVADRRRRFLGQAIYSSQSQIALRLLTSEERPFDAAFLEERIAAAAAYRDEVAPGVEACRMVAAEGDRLPSLIIDRYLDSFVIQTLSQGMEQFKDAVVQILLRRFQARCVVERNEAAVRKLEGLPEAAQALAGSAPQPIVIRENGLQFQIDLLRGQKTGSFLDQRENRAALREYARGRALDCFCYAGGFALNMAAKCSTVLGVDSSADALALARRNQQLNGIANVAWQEANAFDFLRESEQRGEQFHTIVLDPPAFARQRSSQDAALRGYRELNLRALKMLAPAGYLITCSCSFHVSEADLLQVAASAALDARRSVTVVERRTQSRDHPILLTVPETHYLKCLILRAAPV